MAHTDVREQPCVGWLPAEQLPGPGARRWVVELREGGESAQVLARVRGLDTARREPEAAADRLGNLPERHSLVVGTVEARARRRRLECKAIEARGVERMYRGPAILALSDVRGKAILAR